MSMRNAYTTLTQKSHPVHAARRHTGRNLDRLVEVLVCHFVIECLPARAMNRPPNSRSWLDSAIKFILRVLVENIDIGDHERGHMFRIKSAISALCSNRRLS